MMIRRRRAVREVCFVGPFVLSCEGAVVVVVVAHDEVFVRDVIENLLVGKWEVR